MPGFRPAAAALLVLAGLAGACQRSAPGEWAKADNAAANAQAARPETYSERLRAMAEPERRAELAGAARRANEPCDQVASIAAPGARDEVPVWTMACADGGALAMVVGASSVARVLRLRAARPAAPPPPPTPQFGGIYVAATPLMWMPYKVEFNGPRNCLVYTETGYYDSLEEGTCVPAAGGMEFSMGTPFGSATKYFRSEGPDSLSYRRGGRTVVLTRR
jgi:hypothetical protein